MFSKKLFLLQELILCYGFCGVFVPATLCCPSTETQSLTTQEVELREARRLAAEKYAERNKDASCQESGVSARKPETRRTICTLATIKEKQENGMQPWLEKFTSQKTKDPSSNSEIQTLTKLENKRMERQAIEEAKEFIKMKFWRLETYMSIWIDLSKELDKLEEKVIEYVNDLFKCYSSCIRRRKCKERNLGLPLESPSKYGNPRAMPFPKLYEELLSQIKANNEPWQKHIEKVQKRTPVLFLKEWIKIAQIVFAATYLKRDLLFDSAHNESRLQDIRIGLEEWGLGENQEIEEQKYKWFKQIVDRKESVKRIRIEKAEKIKTSLLQKVRKKLSEYSSVIRELGFTEDELMELFYTQVDAEPVPDLWDGPADSNLQAVEENRLKELNREAREEIGGGNWVDTGFVFAASEHEKRQTALLQDYEEKVQQALNALPVHLRGELVPLPPVDYFEEVLLKELGDFGALGVTLSHAWEERPDDFGGLSVAEISKLSEAELAEHFRILEEKKAEKKLKAQQVAADTELQVVRTSSKLQSVGTVTRSQNVEPAVESQSTEGSTVTGERQIGITSTSKPDDARQELRDVDFVAESQPTGIVQTLQENPLLVVAAIGAMAASAWVGLSEYGDKVYSCGSKACSTVTSLFTKSSAKTPHSKVVHRRVLD